jgi:hypothetical protein
MTETELQSLSWVAKTKLAEEAGLNLSVWEDQQRATFTASAFPETKNLQTEREAAVQALELADEKLAKQTELAAQHRLNLERVAFLRNELSNGEGQAAGLRTLIESSREAVRTYGLGRDGNLTGTIAAPQQLAHRCGLIAGARAALDEHKEWSEAKQAELKSAIDEVTRFAEEHGIPLPETI